MASQGVTVISQVGGQFVMLDPVSTEAAGANLTQYAQISASTQVDVTSTSVEAAIADTLVGIVPTSIDSFILALKTTIGNTLVGLITSGSIGPFQNPDQSARKINFNTDIVAFQSPTDATKFYFQYYYFLRYPALRFFGQFSVDSPFALSSSAGASS
jgi:hypothetical protein